MKMKLALALVLACGTAQAAEWVSLGKSGDGTMEFLINTDSIRLSGHERRAWIKTLFRAHTLKDPYTDTDKWVSFTLDLNVFDCGAETHGIDAITAYYEDGTNASMPRDSRPTPMNPVVPDTVEAAGLKFACSWKPK